MHCWFCRFRLSYDFFGGVLKIGSPMYMVPNPANPSQPLLLPMPLMGSMQSVPNLGSIGDKSSLARATSSPMLSFPNMLSMPSLVPQLSQASTNNTDRMFFVLCHGDLWCENPRAFWIERKCEG